MTHLFLHRYILFIFWTRDISITKPIGPINYMGSYTLHFNIILDNDNRYEEETEEEDKREVVKLNNAFKAFYNCQSHSITLKHRKCRHSFQIP